MEKKLQNEQWRVLGNKNAWLLTLLLVMVCSTITMAQVSIKGNLTLSSTTEFSAGSNQLSSDLSGAIDGNVDPNDVSTRVLIG